MSPSQPDKTFDFPPSPSFDIPLPTSDPPMGPCIEKPTFRLDDVFNFQTVVFEVYMFPVFKIFTWRNDHNIFPKKKKRSRIYSFKFIRIASTFREPLSRPCLHYRRLKWILVLLKAVILKIPSICKESRWTTFGLSCVSYIRCAFLWQLSVKYSRCLMVKKHQHRPKTCRRIWWVGWSAEFSNYVVFPRGPSVFALTKIFCALFCALIKNIGP